jgi:hypothetical protein
MKNWEDIATTSEHHAVVEIKKSFDEGNLVDVEEGSDVMARAEKRAIESQLVRLMHHILKWQIQPQKRSVSWTMTIDNARDEIEAEKKYSPSLNDSFIESIWGNALRKARRNAEKETYISTKHIENLTWEEVFEIEYNI